jgi:glycosyltransferase involved in cell wall biosynthesis
MRILTLAAELDAVGGLERAQLQTCIQLRNRGHEIELMFTEPGDLSDAWSEVASRAVRVDGYSLYRGDPVATTRAVGRVVRQIRRLAPDVVYFHHHRHALGPALAGRPSVCHMHLPPPPQDSRQDRFALSRVTVFVAVSQFTAGQWTEQLGLAPGRIEIVHNGVDLSQFTPADTAQRAAVRESVGLPSDRFLILFAARVGEPKGVDVALEAMRLLDAGTYHLALAGESNPADFAGSAARGQAFEAELRRRYDGLPVSWLGRLKDTSALIAAADLVVLPSRFPDPMPLLVLESMASGTPIVASAVGGIPEMLTGELAANLVPSGDPAALAQRIVALMDWRSEQPRLAEIGRRAVERGYTLGRMGDGVQAAVARAAGAR